MLIQNFAHHIQGIKLILTVIPRISAAVECAGAAFDLGCGSGDFCYLLKSNFQVIPKGIDINKDKIETATRRYLYINSEFFII